MPGERLDLGTNPLSFHAAWSGFYKKPLKERRDLLEALISIIWPNDLKKDISLKQDGADTAKGADGAPPLNLNDKQADKMIENYIGRLEMPVGLGLNFTINDEPVVVPMCVEESSVIAATSGAAKTISLYGGFRCSTSERNLVVAQVQLRLPREDLDTALSKLESKRDEILAHANGFCPGMVSRGGGVVSISFKKVIAPSCYDDLGIKLFGGSSGSWLIVNLSIDTCEAMGANCASSVAEGTSSFLASIANAEVGVRITSNFTPERFATASFCIPVDCLGYKKFSGEHLARGILESNTWAACDISRATTHNKGIMNGIDAVALATGQDWRAIEASCHAYATVKDPSSKYAPLTDYWVDSDPTICSYKERSGNIQGEPLYFHGSLTLALPVGTKGGALSMNDAYDFCLKVLGSDANSKKLSQIMVAVGLAQNFAALRALCTEGIQSGHMSLHAHNIATQAGVPEGKIPECIRYMKSINSVTVSAAKKFLSMNECD